MVMVWWANSAHYHYTRAGALRSRMLERILSLSIVAMVMMSQSPSGSPVLVSQMSGKSTPTSTSGTRAAYQTDTELYRLLVVVMVFAMCTAFCLCLVFTSRNSFLLFPLSSFAGTGGLHRCRVI